MHHITRRLSPSLILASVALFVALAGTAAAAVVIKSPDELGDNVVTGRAIAPNAITTSDITSETVSNSRLRNPQLKVRVFKDGSVISGSNGTAARVSKGTYNVTFNVSALNAIGSGDTLLTNDCAFTATPRDQPAWLTVLGPVAGLPNTVRVDAVFPDPAHPEVLVGVDRSFDIIAHC
jgi:hypothetical protein